VSGATAAQAAQLQVQDGEIQYLAAPGEKNNPKLVTQAGDTLGFRTNDSVPLTAGPGCADQTLPSGAAGVMCSVVGVRTLRLSLGDANDKMSEFLGSQSISTDLALIIRGGPGNDELELTGRAGKEPPASAFRSVRLEGGTGDDRVFYLATIRGTLRGGTGHDLLLTIHAKRDKPQLLVGGAGNDSLASQGLAADVFRGGAGNDVINSADGFGAADRVSCGTGNDGGTMPYRPNYDSIDRVAADCERPRYM